MDLHDYIIISQNKQNNSRLCTILDYHMACSDHDERVAKVGPAMRITELEAKSKGKRRAARFFILRGVWRLSIIYCLLVIFDVHIRRPNASTRPLHVQPSLFRNSPIYLPLPREGPWHYSKYLLPTLLQYTTPPTINTTSSKKLTP